MDEMRPEEGLGLVPCLGAVMYEGWLPGMMSVFSLFGM